MDQPKYRIEIFWSDEDGGYIANVPDLRYCSAFGESYEEALREVLVAMELHLNALNEMGRPVPEARSWRVVGALADDPRIEGQVVEEAGDAAGQIVDRGSASYEEVLEQAFGVQSSSIRLSREFFESWVEALEDHAELNRRVSEALGQFSEEQGRLLQRSLDALSKSVNATSAARRKAEELGVDLSQIEGTGAGGLITVRDVLGAVHR
jgi:predicted RNase H-like HicB family nuclease